MNAEPIIIEGAEQSRVDPSLADTGLPPAVGVQSWCVFRASRDVPEITDKKGFTYHHHVDMACWKGRLYVGWNSCEKDEDIWPSRELYSTSADGAAWDAPREMFPMGSSTCLRMYFYLGKNGHMLVIAGLRANTSKTNEDTKSALIVREVRDDHTLGDVFTLQAPTGDVKHPKMFDRSGDEEFIAACRQLLADRVFLEQQDRGRLLGARRMKWHDASAWPGGKVPGDSDKWVAGKAFSFYRRPDGILVGVSKMGWTTTSRDDGNTWEQPVVPPTLVTGKAKVWSQRTRDGRYALVYNPSTRQRFPLIVVSGDDGIRFRDMRIVQGELPRQRYEGADRSVGPQYIRGVSPTWSNDGSRDQLDGNAMWLVYSMSKEDIWVSRVPLPVKADETAPVNDDFASSSAFKPGVLVRGWNTYCPKWDSVNVESGALVLENRDPYDYATATRVFREAKRASVTFDVTADQSDSGTLQIDLHDKFGAGRPVRVALAPAGKIKACDGNRTVDVAPYTPGTRVSLCVNADVAAGTYSLAVNGSTVLDSAKLAEPADVLHRITFRTGEFRNVGGKNPVDPGTDKPAEPARFSIVGVRVE